MRVGLNIDDRPNIDGPNHSQSHAVARQIPISSRLSEMNQDMATALNNILLLPERHLAKPTKLDSILIVAPSQILYT